MLLFSKHKTSTEQFQDFSRMRGSRFASRGAGMYLLREFTVVLMIS